MKAYREFAPPDGWATTVGCLWMLAHRPALASEGPDRVLPDGATDIVFSFDRLLVYGPAPSFHLVGVRDYLVGIRLRAEAVRQVLGVNPATLGLGPVPLDALWGRDTPAVENRLMSEPAPGKRLTLLTYFLTEHVRPNARLDSAVVTAIRCINRSPTRSVRTLTDAVHLSERQLRRRFREHVGLGIKQYARIIRFDRLVDAARRHKRQFGAAPPNWAALSFDHGFADQAHLTREVRTFTGLAPTDLYRTL